MVIGVLTLTLSLPGCRSLKEKRSRLKPLLARLHKEFNVSTAEVEANDVWGTAVVACALVSTASGHAQRRLAKVEAWVEGYWGDVTIVDAQVEII